MHSLETIIAQNERAYETHKTGQAEKHCTEPWFTVIEAIIRLQDRVAALETAIKEKG